MKYLIVLLACTAACATPSAPTPARVGVPSAVQLLTALSPWTGTTTATDGRTGVVSSAVFGPAGTVTWTGVTGTYTGTFSTPNLGPGTGQPITILIDGQGAASACHYTIQGAVQTDKAFTGTYDVTGACLDRTGHGTFRLVQS